MKSLAATPLLLVALACAQAFAQTTPDHAEAGDDRADQARRAADARPTPPRRWRRRSARRSSPTSPGSALYNGAITGEVSERMINAIKAYQKDLGAKQTGVLNPQERTTLAAAAKKLQNDVGWKIAADPINGIRLGVPTKLVPQNELDRQCDGSKWTSAQGQIQIETWRCATPTRSPPSPSARRRSRPAARSTTAWCGRTSSCCRACRA